MRFSGQVVLVTGASAGLGEAVAMRFAAERARVVLAARLDDQGAEVARRSHCPARRRVPGTPPGPER